MYKEEFGRQAFLQLFLYVLSYVLAVILFDLLFITYLLIDILIKKINEIQYLGSWTTMILVYCHDEICI